MTHKHRPLSRRQFVRSLLAAGGGALLSRVGSGPVHAAHQAAPTLLPSRRTPDGPARIALVKTSDRAAGVMRALNLFGDNPVQGKQVVLKPNFNTSDAPPGATHNDTLSSMAIWLRASGAETITVGDRSWQGAHSVMQAKGIYDMAQRLNFATASFDDLAPDSTNWHWVLPESSHWQYGFTVARPIWDAESVVATCCLKTHGYGGHYTITLKNAVGIVAATGPCGDRQVALMDELHGEVSRHMRRMIAEINLAWSPDLYLVDAVDAFVAGGPMTGTLAHPEAILVGTDQVALDAVGVALLRMHGAGGPVSTGRIFDTEQIARAVELGIGIDSPEKIEFITEDDASAAYATQIRERLLA